MFSLLICVADNLHNTLQCKNLCEKDFLGFSGITVEMTTDETFRRGFCIEELSRVTFFGSRRNLPFS